MSIETIPFDMAALLDSDEAIREYFAQVLDDGDADEIVRALSHIARARGMGQLAKDAGLGRESLYKTLSEGGKPRFETILKIVRALGLKLAVHPA
ncbi:MAG: putative addiction module antidote protein [Azoarcus sp.]|jgi:probable addiction module antidote protein|nr:putative addiction module antidote protein [Azoarcus sp.]